MIFVDNCHTEVLCKRRKNTIFDERGVPTHKNFNIFYQILWTEISQQYKASTETFQRFDTDLWSEVHSLSQLFPYANPSPQIFSDHLKRNLFSFTFFSQPPSVMKF